MTNDFLSKLLQLSNSQPQVPLMDPNAEDEPKQEDFEVAQEPIEIGQVPKPDLTKRKEILDQYKSFRSPTAEIKPVDESELENHLKKMETDGSSRVENEVSSHDFDQAAMTGIPEVQESQLSSKSRILSDFQRLKNAQANYSDRLSDLSLLGAGNKFAQAMALGHGAKIGDNSEGIQQLQQAARQPVSNIEDQMKLGGTDMNDPASDISRFMREQAYAVLKKISPDKDYTGQLEEMSAAQLQKLPGMKNALSNGGINKAVGFGMYIDAETNHPLYFDQDSRKVIDSITSQPIAPGVKIARPIGYQDVFGNRDYLSSQGNVRLSSSTRPNVSPEQLDKQSEVSGFKPDEKQRDALDKEKGRIDILTKNVNEKLSASSRILGALDGDSKQAMAVIKTQMPRLAGEVGNLNQAEQEVWGGSQALLDRIEQYVGTKVGSELTEDNKQELRKILGIFLKEAETSRQNIMNNSVVSLAEIHNIPPSFTMKAYPAIKTVTPRQQEVIDGKVGGPGKNKQVDTKPDVKQNGVIFSWDAKENKYKPKVK